MTTLLPYALAFAVAGGAAMLGKTLWDRNKIGDGYAILYEKIGETEVFKDIVKINKVKTNSITCLSIVGESECYIDIPDSNDYFQSKKYGKVLHIVRFGERDYRIKKRFNQNWFREVEEQVFEYKTVTDEETGEEITEKYPVLNKGNPVYEIVKEGYSEPLGVDQDGMDAVRVGLQNEREIKKELDSQKFWDKYGAQIVQITIFMICALLVMKVTSDNKDAVLGISNKCDIAAGKAEQAAKAINEPKWFEKVVDWKREQDAPKPPD